MSALALQSWHRPLLFVVAALLQALMRVGLRRCHSTARRPPIKWAGNNARSPQNYPVCLRRCMTPDKSILFDFGSAIVALCPSASGFCPCALCEKWLRCRSSPIPTRGIPGPGRARCQNRRLAFLALLSPLPRRLSGRRFNGHFAILVIWGFLLR